MHGVGDHPGAGGEVGREGEVGPEGQRHPVQEDQRTGGRVARPARPGPPLDVTAGVGGVVAVRDSAGASSPVDLGVRVLGVEVMAVARPSLRERAVEDLPGHVDHP